MRRLTFAENPFTLGDAFAVGRLVRGGMVTQGKHVREFEGQFGNRISHPNAVMVNSGSSANLLGVAALYHDLQERGIKRREVIMPALTWSTTVAPWIQYGFKPVFVDVDTTGLVDLKRVEEAITPDTAAICIVHLLGQAHDLVHLEQIKTDHPHLAVFEDCCEAWGATWDGRPVGTVGHFASFSFYFSHQYTTIEGGVLCTTLYPDEVRSMREHGWTRDYPDHRMRSLEEKHPDIDPSWMFDNLGYNLRATEIQGLLGLRQMGHQDKHRHQRILNAQYLEEHLPHELTERTRERHPMSHRNPFSYPLLVPRDVSYTRQELMAHLDAHSIDTRPVMTGNITKHPWYARHSETYRVHGELHTTNTWHTDALLVPVAPHLRQRDLRRIVDTVYGFLEAR